MFHAYFINGPQHGTRHLINKAEHSLRIAGVPGLGGFIPPGYTENVLRIGEYRRTGTLAYDPVNLKAVSQRESMCYIYEWVGWK